MCIVIFYTLLFGHVSCVKYFFVYGIISCKVSMTLFLSRLSLGQD